MAAPEIDDSEPLRPGSLEYLSRDALHARLEEEVNRAARHGTALSCLLLSLEDLSELRRTHDALLSEQVLAYVELALRRALRRFDRVGCPSEGELLIVLPGADGQRSEVVARRLLQRLRSIKLESSGERRPLRVLAGLAPWRTGMSASALLRDAREAALPENGRPVD